jgi:hypothetical protein
MNNNNNKPHSESKDVHVPVTHICNTVYLGGWDQKDYGLRPVWANDLGDPISKIPRAK